MPGTLPLSGRNLTLARLRLALTGDQRLTLTAAARDRLTLDAARLRQLAASGLISIGSHAHTHRSLGLMPPDEAVAEAVVDVAEHDHPAARRAAMRRAGAAWAIGRWPMQVTRDGRPVLHSRNACMVQLV